MRASGKSPVARRVFDGTQWHENACLSFADGLVTAVIPGGVPSVDLVVPGFVDLQVNGGGGVLLNNEAGVDGLRTICAAHASVGTTSLLATLITDAPEVTQKTLKAVAQARAEGLPGLAGVHLEGPHLDPKRVGTHDPALVRPMDEADVQRLEAAAGLGARLMTLAPEAVSPEQVARLVRAGWTVSLGHSDCDAQTAARYVDAGTSMATHLFNAMSQMAHRAPGLVGAVLDEGRVSCGLIADGHHVSDTMMRIALRAKAGPGKVFLVSDAMAVTGTQMTEFSLNGRRIYRKDGRLTLADGTLAGADVTMLEAVRYCVRRLDLPLEEALRMATLYPAQAMGMNTVGRLAPGAQADFLLLDEALALQGVWQGGREAAA